MNLTFKGGVHPVSYTHLKTQEGPALGAAILAGVGAGVYGSVQQGCEAVIRTGTMQKPVAENSAEYEKYYRIYREIYLGLKEQFRALADMEGTGD